MRFCTFFIAVILNTSGFSQANLPNDFKIGNFVEVFDGDSIKIYFACTGDVVDKTCANYYRVGKMDSSSLNVSGDFIDYDINGNIFFKATIISNNIEGQAVFYHKNGQIKEEGAYLHNIRNGKWNFYYRDGKIEKVYYYNNGEPVVQEAYTPNGNATVVNGNGALKTDFKTYSQCGYYIASGDILNGLRTGKWSLTNPKAYSPFGFEIYEQGKFIREEPANPQSSYKPVAGLTSYYANENINFIDNHITCPGDRFKDLVTYSGKHLNESFYPYLQDNLLQYKGDIQNQWLIVGLKISKKNIVQNINLASSINDTILENYIWELISKMTDWKAPVINGIKTEANLFFTILVVNGQIIIPADYIYRQPK